MQGNLKGGSTARNRTSRNQTVKVEVAEFEQKRKHSCQQQVSGLQIELTICMNEDELQITSRERERDQTVNESAKG